MEYTKRSQKKKLHLYWWMIKSNNKKKTKEDCITKIGVQFSLHSLEIDLFSQKERNLEKRKEK